jgi:hypothetical protein
MERVLKIKSSDFINWFFNSGSDQEQIEQVLTLGRYIADLLLEGSVTIRPQDILDGCEQSVIPLSIVQGYDDSLCGLEIQDGIDYGRIHDDFRIELV